MLQEPLHMLMSSAPRRKSFILRGPLALGEATMMMCNKVTQTNSTLYLQRGTCLKVQTCISENQMRGPSTDSDACRQIQTPDLHCCSNFLLRHSCLETPFTPCEDIS